LTRKPCLRIIGVRCACTSRQMSGKQISKSSYKLHLVALLEEKLHHVHVQDVDACPTEHNVRFRVTWLLEV
jgi:aminoglycoside phosphotransferase